MSEEDSIEVFEVPVLKPSEDITEDDIEDWPTQELLTEDELAELMEEV